MSGGGTLAKVLSRIEIEDSNIQIDNFGITDIDEPLCNYGVLYLIRNTITITNVDRELVKSVNLNTVNLEGNTFDTTGFGPLNLNIPLFEFSSGQCNSA